MRNRSNCKDYLVLLCSDTTLTEDEAIALYAKRWDIEVFFKTCNEDRKQKTEIPYLKGAKTMKNEKHLNENPAFQELPDESLDAVTGGSDTYTALVSEVSDSEGKHKIYEEYEWKGSNDNLKYLCPRCHRPVHYGGWGRYFCDPCDESWFCESNLKMNPAGGWVFVKRYSETSKGVRHPSLGL